MKTQTKILEPIVDYLKYYGYEETELKNDMITLNPASIKIENKKIDISFYLDTEPTEVALITQLVKEASADFTYLLNASKAGKNYKVVKDVAEVV